MHDILYYTKNNTIIKNINTYIRNNIYNVHPNFEKRE